MEMSFRKEAMPVPVQQHEILVKKDTQILADPNSQYGGTLREVYSGEFITVYDYYLPDTIGFGSENEKWYPLVGGGWVAKSAIPAIPERKVSYITYDETGRKITFDDATYLYTPEPTENYIVPNDGKTYARFAYDWERPDWNYKPRTNSEVPHTVPMWDKPDFYALTEDWQGLWKSLIDWACHGTMTEGQLLTAWADITTERKALTDNHGLAHQYTDYVLGLYLNQNKPIMQKGLGFAGNLIKRRYGDVIFALDPSNPAPKLEWLLERPWLWGWCSSITHDSRSIKWPNLKPFGGWGVPYLLLGYGEKNTVKSEHYVKLENGRAYDLYV